MASKLAILAVLVAALVAGCGSDAPRRDPDAEIRIDFINVESDQYVCFTLRTYAIDCHKMEVSNGP